MNPLTLIAKLCDIIDEAIRKGDTILSCPTVDVARQYLAEQAEASKPAHVPGPSGTLPPGVEV